MQPPFNYDLNLSSSPGTNGRVMICFHGYGDNSDIAFYLRNLKCIDSTLISFNFPEYDINKGRKYDPKSATFGSIDELLPAFYTMKLAVLDEGLESIDLYGFSAGGGALINVIAILNTSNYDLELKKIGIKKAEKKKLLSAIQKGIVVLDAPFKSIEEIIDLRGSTAEFKILAKKYRTNDLRPIDSLKRLKGLSLNILLYFQEKDEVLSNRDDNLYIERLKKHQVGGKLTVIKGSDGKHTSPHLLLWQAYSQKIHQLNPL